MSTRTPGGVGGVAGNCCAVSDCHPLPASIALVARIVALTEATRKVVMTAEQNVAAAGARRQAHP